LRLYWFQLIIFIVYPFPAFAGNTYIPSSSIKQIEYIRDLDSLRNKNNPLKANFFLPSINITALSSLVGNAIRLIYVTIQYQSSRIFNICRYSHSKAGMKLALTNMALKFLFLNILNRNKYHFFICKMKYSHKALFHA
jgi:hypothetical protein